MHAQLIEALSAQKAAQNNAPNAKRIKTTSDQSVQPNSSSAKGMLDAQLAQRTANDLNQLKPFIGNLVMPETFAEPILTQISSNCSQSSLEVRNLQTKL